MDIDPTIMGLKKHTLEEWLKYIRLIEEEGKSSHALAREYNVCNTEILFYYRLYVLGGPEKIAEHMNRPRKYCTAAFKRKVVRYIEDKQVPLIDAAIKFDLALGTVSKWCKQAEKYGIESLVDPNYHVPHKKDRKAFLKWHDPSVDEDCKPVSCEMGTKSVRKRKTEVVQVNDNEAIERLERKIQALEAEVQYLKAENAIRKKAKALVEERMLQKLSQKNGQKSSLD